MPETISRTQDFAPLAEFCILQPIFRIYKNGHGSLDCHARQMEFAALFLRMGFKD